MSSRVSVFVDVGNQFYCINKKWPGRKLNYEKYLEKTKTFGTLGRAFAYGTQVDDTAAKFITALHHLGFEPQYKQVEKNVWYSWNVGMAMDIVRLVTNNKTDTIIIGNSDRSLSPVISWAKEKGVRVIVIACGINKELKLSCDRWVEIDEAMLESETAQDSSLQYDPGPTNEEEGCEPTKDEVANTTE
jgi:uncharacterized protein (TIGR00288 family)